MTGIPATDMTAFSLNLPAGKALGNSPRNMEQSFADIMNGSGNRTEAPVDSGKTKASANASGSENQALEKNGNGRPDKISNESVDSGKSPEKLSGEKAGKLEETAKDLKEEIADALDVTVEELEAAMEALGLSFGDLMNPTNLAKLTAEMVEEMDGLTLVTDEALFEGLKELSGQVAATVEELAKELGVKPEEIVSMLEEAVKGTEGKEQPDNALVSGGEAVLVSSGEAVFAQAEGLTGEEAGNVAVKAFQASEDVQDETPAVEDGKEYATVPKETSVKETAADGQQTAQEGLKDNNRQSKSHTGLGQEAAGAIQQPVAYAEGNAAPLKMEAPLPAVDPQSILDQIGEAVRVTGGEDFTSMEMQIHPESLGTLHLQVRAKEGIITAQFTTESEAVKQVLEAQVIQLREKLENQGVKVEAVEVLVASHEFERNLEKGGSQEKNAYEAKKVTRRKINLNVPEGEEETDLSDEEKDAVEIQKDMMERNGNTLDYMV